MWDPGSVTECTEKLAEIVRAGAQHLLLNPMFDDLEHLELLAQEVLPHSVERHSSSAFFRISRSRRHGRGG